MFPPFERLQREPLYETTLKANRRTAEYRISNVEGWFRFAQSFLKWTVRHKSSQRAEFIYSMFTSFFFDLTGRFFGRRLG
jgi:hypothetical protein